MTEIEAAIGLVQLDRRYGIEVGKQRVRNGSLSQAIGGRYKQNCAPIAGVIFPGQDPTWRRKVPAIAP